MKRKLLNIILALGGIRLVAHAQTKTVLDTPGKKPQPTKGNFYIKKPQNDTSVNIKLNAGSKYKITIAPITQDPSAYDWLKRISIVRSFDSKPDMTSAATASMVFPKDSSSSINFAFALGYNVLPTKWSENSAAQFNPFFEWQKNTLVSKKQDVITSGLNFQSLLPKFTSAFQFYMTSALNYKYDRGKSAQGTQANVYFTPSFQGHDGDFYFLPDAQMRNGAIEIIYNLYGGLEYESTASAKNADDKGDVFRLNGRVVATISPLPDLLDERLQFVPDYTARTGFSKTIANEAKTNKLWKYAINLVIVKQATSKFGDVSIGYTHQQGVDPTAGFQNQSVGTFSLSVKVIPGGGSR